MPNEEVSEYTVSLVFSATFLTSSGVVTDWGVAASQFGLKLHQSCHKPLLLSDQ